MLCLFTIGLLLAALVGAVHSHWLAGSVVTESLRQGTNTGAVELVPVCERQKVLAPQCHRIDFARYSSC